MFITHKKSDRLPLHQAHADQRRAHCLRLGTFQIEYQKHLRKKKTHKFEIEGGGMSHCLHGLAHTKWCRISAINNIDICHLGHLHMRFFEGEGDFSAHHDRTCGHLYKLHQDTWVCHTKNQHFGLYKKWMYSHSVLRGKPKQRPNLYFGRILGWPNQWLLFKSQTANVVPDRPQGFHNVLLLEGNSIWKLWECQ